MDLTILNDRPEKRARCKACSWDVWLTLDSPPPHSCRTAPATPRATIEDRRRAANAIFLKKELEIRAARLAEIDLSRIRRGRI